MAQRLRRGEGSVQAQGHKKAVIMPCEVDYNVHSYQVSSNQTKPVYTGVM